MRYQGRRVGVAVLRGPKCADAAVIGGGEEQESDVATRPHAPRLVGRSVEAERLLSLMAMASRGSGQAVVLTGAPSASGCFSPLVRSPVLALLWVTPS